MLCAKRPVAPRAGIARRWVSACRGPGESLSAGETQPPQVDVLRVTKGLVIWGASGHALVVADIVRQLGAYEIVGFLDDLNTSRTVLNAPVLGGREQLPALRSAGIDLMIVAVG